MSTWVRAFGWTLLALSTILAVMVVWAANRGFFGDRGLLVDLPMQGRLLSIPVGVVVGVIVLTALLAIGILLAGRRDGDRNQKIGPQSISE